MKDARNVLVVGIPDSGKTNFIIRLWLALRQNTCLLQSDGDPDEIEYLESGAAHQLSGEYAPHTPHDVFNHNAIPVKSAAEDIKGILQIPDYSGEVWERLYKNREWPVEWDSLITQNTAFLLLIRADSDGIVPSLDFISMEREFGELGAIASIASTQKKSVIPTEVIITEWLQFFRRVFTDLVGGQYKPRVAIVISAWDLVPADQQGLGPDPYIEMNYPMLNQFINANSDQFNFKAFGVSITGGDLNDPDFKDDYIENNPKNAGFVIFHKGKNIQSDKDTTLPVAWSMGVF